jgi:SAM-dependent methyltransferase
MAEYVLDNQAVQAGYRFRALSALFDAVTERHFAAIGVGPGWRCWEVGAGGPAVPRLMAERACAGGAPGTVLATDIDVRWLDDVPEGVEVRQHDVARDELPATGFDLIHARLVFAHIAEREEVVGRLASALRPGGYLFIEDVDATLNLQAFLDPQMDAEHLGNRMREGFVRLLEQRGVDTAWGRRLPRVLRASGLVDVVCDARLTLEHPGGAELERANVDQVRAGLVGLGLATDEEIETYLAALDHLTPAGPPLVSAYGRASGM